MVGYGTNHAMYELKPFERRVACRGAGGFGRIMRAGRPPC